MLARRRAEVYDALVPLDPGRLGPRRGDVLASVVDDVDSVLDRELRGRMPVRGLVLVAALAAGLTACSTSGVGAGRRGHVRGRRPRPRDRPGRRRLAASRAASRARARLSERVVETTQVADELVMWQAGERAVAAVADASDELGAGQRPQRPLAAASAGCSRSSLRRRRRGRRLLRRARGRARVTCRAPIAALLVLLPLALAEVVLARRRRRHRLGPGPRRRGPARRARSPCRRRSSRPGSPVPAPGDTAVDGRPGRGRLGRPARLSATCRSDRAARSPDRRRRALRLGQEHPRRRCCCASSTRGRGGPARRGRPARTSRSTTYAARSGWSTTTRTSSPRTVAENIRLARPDGHRRRGRRGAARRPASGSWLDGLADGLATLARRRARRGLGRRARPARPWPGRCWPTSRCWCSTSRPPTSTTPRPSSWPPRCSPRRRRRGRRVDHPRAGRARPRRRDRGASGAHGDEFAHPRGGRGARHTP